MTLATLDSLNKNKYDLNDMMYRFALWMTKNRYTPHRETFDIGIGTSSAIIRWLKDRDVTTCGGNTEWDNGNGSLMRILPVCLYGYRWEKTGELSEAEVISRIHEVSGLTHNHLRSKIACGLYYFCIKAILDELGTLAERLKVGMTHGFAFYEQCEGAVSELGFYNRLRNLTEFAEVGEKEIRSSGYVVDTLEAVVWCLLNTDSFAACVLKAVNLGDDTDTVGAIAGGLAGLWYGHEAIPKEWRDVIVRRKWIEQLCEGMKDE
jgi:ADP-ribosylglycohydrolase